MAAPRRFVLPALVFCLALGGALAGLHVMQAGADEWNDTFATPRQYRVLRDIAVRSGPGNSHQRLGSVSAGEVLLVSEIIKGWHRFAYHGQQGWIFKRYLRPMAAGEPQQAPATPELAPQPLAGAESSGSDAVSQALQELESESTEESPDPDNSRNPEKSDEAEGQELQDLPEKLPEVLPEALPEDSSVQKSMPDGDQVEKQPAEVPQSETALPSRDELPGKEAVTQTPDGTIPLKESEQELLEEEAPQEEQTSQEQSQTEAAQDPAPETREPLPVLEPADLADCERFISLQPGEKSRKASIQKSLAAGEKGCYRILALEGWILEVTLESENNAALFDVFSPTQGRLVSSMRAWAHPVQRSGDKQIVVYGGDAPIRYTLGIQVR